MGARALNIITNKKILLNLKASERRITTQFLVRNNDVLYLNNVIVRTFRLVFKAFSADYTIRFSSSYTYKYGNYPNDRRVNPQW